MRTELYNKLNEREHKLYFYLESVIFETLQIFEYTPETKKICREVKQRQEIDAKLPAYIYNHLEEVKKNMNDELSYMTKCMADSDLLSAPMEVELDIKLLETPSKDKEYLFIFTLKDEPERKWSILEDYTQ